MQAKAVLLELIFPILPPFPFLFFVLNFVFATFNINLEIIMRVMDNISALVTIFYPNVFMWYFVILKQLSCNCVVLNILITNISSLCSLTLDLFPNKDSLLSLPFDDLEFSDQTRQFFKNCL